VNRLELALSRTLTAAAAHLLIKGDFAAAEATLGFLFHLLLRKGYARIPK